MLSCKTALHLSRKLAYFTIDHKAKILPSLTGSCKKVDCFGSQKEINSRASSTTSMGSGKCDRNRETILFVHSPFLL